MEADWEVEIGDGAPVIDADWDGLIDLRGSPERVALLPEVMRFPALEEALVKLNSPSCLFWTAKCDLWEPHEFDPDELDATPQQANAAIACYVDLLPCTNAEWSSPDQAIAECRSICARLRNTPLSGSRADLVVRRAYVAGDRAAIGITAYLTACGSTQENAADGLGNALRLFVDSIMRA